VGLYIYIFNLQHSILEEFIACLFRVIVGRIAQSVYRLATGWTVRGSNTGGDEIFRTFPDRPWGPPSLLYIGYTVFLWGKERPGREADPSPLPLPWSRKSTATPVLPLWAVRPVQSLSACTRVHFNFLSQGCNSSVQDHLKASELHKTSVYSPKHKNVRDEGYDGLHANRKTQF